MQVLPLHFPPLFPSLYPPFFYRFRHTHTHTLTHTHTHTHTLTLTHIHIHTHARVHTHTHTQIYTYIGEVVVSVNPYRKLNIYTDEFVFDYRAKEPFERPPHIYAIADSAFHDMRFLHNDSCIVIGGKCIHRYYGAYHRQRNGGGPPTFSRLTHPHFPYAKQNHWKLLILPVCTNLLSVLSQNYVSLLLCLPSTVINFVIASSTSSCHELVYR